MTALWLWLKGHPYVWLPILTVVFTVLSGARKGKVRLPTEREGLDMVVSCAGIIGTFSIFEHLCGPEYSATDLRPWAMAIGALLMGLISFRLMAATVSTIWSGGAPARPTVSPTRREASGQAESNNTGQAK